MGPRERVRHTHEKSHVIPIVIASFVGFFLLAGVAFGAGMIANVNKWLQDLPDYTNTELYLTSEPTTILDAQGNQIASFYSQNRETVTIDQVSPYVLDGTVATEDERFYEHAGVDLYGIARAAVVQLMGGSEGASTITQQLVRNTILSDEQFDITLERKVREAYLALKVEEIYSKEEILMMYLNTIYYGHGAYGIEAAANTYLSKHANELTLAEAALLVGLPNSPSMYDPTVNPDLAVERRNTVLDRMLSNGKITQEEHDAAQAEPLTLNVSETSSTGIEVNAYPEFVEYIRALMEEEFSYESIFSGGLTVYTTIDPNVQNAAQTAVTDQLNAVGLSDLARLADAFYIGGTKLGALFGEALVILNPELDRDFRYIEKQRGGMLAKGRLLGVQFLTLMTDGLYERTARREVELALRLRAAFEAKGWPLYYDSPTNQQFPVVPDAALEKLAEKYSFSDWGRVDEAHRVVRFCTSWATREEDVDALIKDVAALA